jgi:Fe-S-cluster-containing dehydrogenase component
MSNSSPTDPSSDANAGSEHSCSGNSEACGCGGSSGGGVGMNRRTALKAIGATLGAAAFAQAIAPLTQWTDDLTIDDYLQKHYKELSPFDLGVVMARMEKETKEATGVDVHIGDYRPQPGVKFGYALNLSVCVGCRRCAKACHVENNHDRPSGNSYIRVLEMQKGSLDLAKGRVNYDHAVPDAEKFYMPVQCQQCDKPPCVSVCPVEATWKEADGIVVVDYNWCIGCRYCEAACPYHARRFNWKKPEVPAAEINPDQGYLSNRLRPQGVMEKCTFCLHRSRQGKLPACLEACPTGARVFGNLLDPESEIRWVLKNKRVFVLKEDVGTQPSFFYFFDV